MEYLVDKVEQPKSIDLRILGIIFIVLFFSFIIIPANDIDYYLSLISEYAENYTPEKVYVHTDKPYYTNGDTIWMKTYLVDGMDHVESIKSKVVHIELLNSKDSLVYKQKIYMEEIGSASDIAIPSSWEEDVYLLRAYTNYMRNTDNAYFFQKEIPIWIQNPRTNLNEKDLDISNNPIAESTANATERPLLTFFPEGGDLIENLSTNLAIKASDKFGNAIAVNGKIVDQENTDIQKFECLDFGLAKINFLPEQGKDYKAILEINGIEQVYNLPRILKNGFVLNISNRIDQLLINIQTSNQAGLEGSFLIGHMRGRVFCEFQMEIKGNQANYKLLTDTLQSGIAQFTLFNKDGEPMCERLVYMEHSQSQLNLAITKEKETFSKREKVAMSFDLKDHLGKNIGANLSLSVIDADLVQLPKNADNIKTWLLLNGDLKGKIDDAAALLDDLQDYKKVYFLDLLLLTHGWRRFDWKAPDSFKYTNDFKIENGLFLSGRTTNFYSEKIKPSKVILNFLNLNFYQDEQQTNEKGEFEFGPFILFDTVNVILQATVPPKKITEKTKPLAGNRNIKILIDQEPEPPAPSRDFLVPFKFEDSNTIKKFLKSNQSAQLIKEQFDGLSYEFEELLVRGKRETQEDKVKKILDERAGAFKGAESRIIVTQRDAGLAGQSPLNLLRTIAGVNVTGSFPNQSVEIRGPSSLNASTAPLFVLDGVPVDVTTISTTPVQDILFIDVFKGASSSIFGMRGGNGVIAVYTKRGEDIGEEPEDRIGIKDLRFKGFYKSRSFYNPNYSVVNDNKRPDFRSTIFWEPNLIFDAEETVARSFYTADQAGKYQIVVEGISQDGRVIYHTESFEVTN